MFQLTLIWDGKSVNYRVAPNFQICTKIYNQT